MDAIGAITAAPPEDVLATAAARFDGAGVEGQRRLALLVERLEVSDAPALLEAWLRVCDPGAGATILRALVHRGRRVERGELTRWLASRDGGTREAAMAAAGASEDVGIAPLVASFLDDPALGRHAALALGRLGARVHTRAIVDRVLGQRELAFGAFLVALELMNDASAIEPLRQLLPQAPVRGVWDLHHALVRLTGREPVYPLGEDREATAHALRAAWAEIDLARAPRPRLESMALTSPSELTWTAHETSGRICIDYDPPPPGSQWPRWNKSLYVDGRPLYGIGSDCGTCETSLRLAGWPTDRAAAATARVRGALADVPKASVELARALEPLFGELRPGHYVATCVDLHLEWIGDPKRSWYGRRRTLRDGRDREDRLGIGTPHFQVPSVIPGPEPTFAIVLPSQDPASIDGATVDGHAAAIAAGARPACIALSWLEWKEVRGEFLERVLVGVVLDGHHKLAAYARAGVPARTLLVCRIEDTYGPAEDRPRWFLDAARVSVFRLKGPPPA